MKPSLSSEISYIGMTIPIPSKAKTENPIAYVKVSILMKSIPASSIRPPCSVISFIPNPKHDNKVMVIIILANK